MLCKFATLLVLGTFLATACSTATPSLSPSIERNVVWQASLNLKADVYKPSTAGIHPAVLMVHGGGWSAGNRADLDGVARELAARGMVAITGDYRLIGGPNIGPNEPVADVIAALDFLKSKAAVLNVDSSRLAIFGNYIWTGDLRTASGNVIVGADNRGLLNSGDNTVRLVFNGLTIGQSKQNGPYASGNMTVYPADSSFGNIGIITEEIAKTKAYRSSQLEGGVPVPTPALISNGISARGTVVINGTRVLQNGAVVTPNDPSATAPNVQGLLDSLGSCAKVVQGDQDVKNITQLDALFQGSDCIEVQGNLNFYYRAVLMQKRVFLPANRTLNAISGLEIRGGFLKAGSVTINSNLLLADSRLLTIDSNRWLSINGTTTMTGLSSLVSGGNMTLNGGINASSIAGQVDAVLLSRGSITLNIPITATTLIWAGTDFTSNGKLKLTGAIQAGGKVSVNGGVELLLEKRTLNPDIPRE